MNLIDNAIKHSPSGTEVLVTLAAEERSLPPHPDPLPQGVEGKERGRDYLRLSVEDHGPGIPASEHEKIFERFYRLGSELRRETQGVGIGLTIVKHIVEAKLSDDAVSAHLDIPQGSPVLYVERDHFYKKRLIMRTAGFYRSDLFRYELRLKLKKIGAIVLSNFADVATVEAVTKRMLRRAAAVGA